MNRGTFLNGRVNYIQLTVVEKSTGHEIWHVKHYHTGDANVPDYGDRSHERFIKWAPDSSSVTIPIANGREQTFAVP